MRLVTILLFLGTFIELHAQNPEQYISGKVTYVSSQHIYVRFNDVNNLETGDTVFTVINHKYQPLFIIESRSSLTCMGKPLDNNFVAIGTVVQGKIKKQTFTAKPEQKIVEAGTNESATEITKNKTGHNNSKQEVNGKVSFSSYATLSKDVENHTLRQRLSISAKADHIANSAFYSDIYINFIQKKGEWGQVQKNIFNALKIYNLSIGYNTGNNIKFIAGRKINSNLSNIGAVDGLQVEYSLKRFKFGTVAGYHPDYFNYSFNTDLFEYGGFAAFESKNEYGYQQSSVAFFEQKNSGKIDRRFIYLQHSNSTIHNLYYFVSSEMDLFRISNQKADHSLKLTSLYLSLRYRFSPTLNLHVSYDNRKNVIYYETFKSLADQMLEEAGRQGARMRINYRPLKFLRVGIQGNYRYKKNDDNTSKTINGTLSVLNIPYVGSTVTLSGNLLQTMYLDGNIWGVKLSKDLVNGLLYLNLGYRKVKYDFINSSTLLLQNIEEIDVSWHIAHKLILSVNYEISIEKNRDNEKLVSSSGNFQYLYLNLSKRF